MYDGFVGARIKIELDDDRLPTSIELEPLWRRADNAVGLGDQILAAYRIAQWRMDRTASESLNWDLLRNVLTRRQQILTLLTAENIDQFQRMVNRAHDPQIYTFGGSTSDAEGRPAVSMTADSSLVTGMFIDPQWSRSASDDDVARELLRCVDRIRTRRSIGSFVHDRSDLTDSDLLEMYRAHLTKLHSNESIAQIPGH